MPASVGFNVHEYGDLFKAIHDGIQVKSCHTAIASRLEVLHNQLIDRAVLQLLSILFYRSYTVHKKEPLNVPCERLGVP